MDVGNEDWGKTLNYNNIVFILYYYKNIYIIIKIIYMCACVCIISLAFLFFLYVLFAYIFSYL